MYEVSSSSAKQESLSWIAATAYWNFESGETNLEVIFAGPEGIDELINMEENEENPSLINDAESVIRGSPTIEISKDAANQEEEHSGNIFFRGVWWHPSEAENWDLYSGDLDDGHCDDSENLIENHTSESENSDGSLAIAPLLKIN